MTTVAQLTIEMAANVARLRQDMAAARTTVDGAMKGIRDSAATAVRALQAIGAGVSVAALANMVRNFAAAGEQIQRFSTLANTSVEDFQRMTFAASRFGVSQEKLADILKDTQDKVGDFLQTGAGPLADFFENVAPKVGVTAEQFRRLSGADALQLYVSSLQKANLSQAEMTFFMEAIASDSTLLLPLLRNNGQAMKDLGDQAERLGQVLDKDAIAQAKRFNDELTLLGSAVSGFGRTVASPIIEGLNRVIEQFRLARQFSGSFYESLFRTGTSNPAERIADLQVKLKRLNEEAARPGLAGLPAARARDAVESAKKDLALLEEVYRRQVRAGEIVNPNDPRAALRGMDRDIPFSDAKPTVTENAADRAKREAAAKAAAAAAAAAAARATAAAQREQAQELQKIITLADYRNRQFDEEFQKEEEARMVVENRIKSGREMLATIELETRMLSMSREERELTTTLLELERQGIVKGTEAYAAYGEAIKKALGEKQAQEALIKRQEATKALAEEEKKENARRTATLAQSIEDGIMTGFRNGQSFADVFLNELKAQFAKTVLRPMIEPIAAAGNALITSLFASVGFPSFAGGGYTGNGSRSGGMDGQGGYLAMLHPRETVVDHAKGQGAGQSINITINNTIGNVASQADVVGGMQAVRAQIMGELSRSMRYGGAAA